MRYEGFPGQQNEINWYVDEPARDGNCTVRINTEFEEDELGFDALTPMDRKTDVNGKFPCGRTKENVYERAIFKFPKVSCDPCVLQFEFETEYGSIFQCADIGLIDEKSVNCAGK